MEVIMKSNMFWGLVIIALGIYVLTSMLGVQFYIAAAVLNFIIGGCLVVYGLQNFVQKRLNFFPFFTFYLGLGFLFYTVISSVDSFILLSTEITTPWVFAGPAALLAAGSSLIMKSKNSQKIYKEAYRSENTYTRFQQEESKNYFTDTTHVLNIQNSFNSSVTIATSKQFEGGFISSRFADTVVDLRQIELVQDAILTVDSAFGNVQITVPHDIKVHVVPMSNVFSSISDQTQNGPSAGCQLTIHASAKFGAITIQRG